MHTYTHMWHTQTHVHTHLTHANTLTHTCDTRKHTYTHMSLTNTYTHTHTHTHAYTHTHLHTLTTTLEDGGGLAEGARDATSATGTPVALLDPNDWSASACTCMNTLVHLSFSH